MSDLYDAYRDAVRSLPDTIDGQSRLPISLACAVTLDELLGEGP